MKILRLLKKYWKKKGWKIKNGKLTKDEQEFEFELLLVSPSLEKLALAFQKNLKTLGITMNVRIVDSSQYSARLTKL